ncbi:MAG: hypothetical protein HUU43_04680 [Ignavibacteriaceae bacterium]|nr:hypothetical protein [Ignavibacteriaceae bacterium]
MKNYSFCASAAFLIALLFITGCSDSNDHTVVIPEVDQTNNGFQTRAVATVLANNCAVSGCHNSAGPQHGLSLQKYSEFLNGSAGRPTDTASTGGGHDHGAYKLMTGAGNYGGGAVIPYYPEKSLLYRMVTGDLESPAFKMPYNGGAIPDSQINTLRAWIEDGAKDFNGIPAYSDTENKIFVCNQGSDNIMVIDDRRNLVKRLIDVDYNKSGSDAPHNIQMHGDYIYVSLIAAGKVVKFSRSTLAKLGEVSGLVYPGMIELTSTGGKAYVSKSSTAPGSYNDIYEIDTQTMTLVRTLTLPSFGLPHGIAITKNDSLLVVANMNQDVIIFIDLVTGDLSGDLLSLSAGGTPVHRPMHTNISPDGNLLFVSCMKSGDVKIIDIKTRTVLQSVKTGMHPMQMAVTSDGNKVYVVDLEENKISVLEKNGTDWALSPAVITNPTFSMLYGCDLSADGKYLYVTSSNQNDGFKPRYKKAGQTRVSTVSIIETATGTVVKTIDVDSYATGIKAR